MCHPRFIPKPACMYCKPCAASPEVSILEMFLCLFRLLTEPAAVIGSFNFGHSASKVIFKAVRPTPEPYLVTSPRTAIPTILHCI
jgi:hypothetical protein